MSTILYMFCKNKFLEASQIGDECSDKKKDYLSQCVEIILNKIAKQFNKTYAGFGLYWAELAVLPSWWIPQRYLYDFENYMFEIRTFQG